MIPTESMKFNSGNTRLFGEFGSGNDDDFYIRIESGYLSKLEIFANSNHSTGEDYCFMRGKGKEEKKNLIQCLRWMADKLEKC